MQQFIINVREENLSFFSELLAQFDFVEIVQPKVFTRPKKKLRTKKQQEFVDGLKQSFREMELHRQGKIKLPTFQEMLDEL
ncbi:MAG: hypothetical protein ACKVUS_21870 [Saprospiraceae bacterium]